MRPSFVASRHNAEARPRSGEKSVCFAACAPPQKAMQTAFGKQGRRLRRFAWPFEQIDWRIGELGELIEIEERARRRRGFLAPAIRRVDARAYALVVVGQVPSQLGEQNTAGRIAKPKFFIRLAILKTDTAFARVGGYRMIDSAFASNPSTSEINVISSGLS